MREVVFFDLSVWHCLCTKTSENHAYVIYQRKTVQNFNFIALPSHLLAELILEALENRVNFCKKHMSHVRYIFNILINPNNTSYKCSPWLLWVEHIRNFSFAITLGHKSGSILPMELMALRTTVTFVAYSHTSAA